MFDIKALGLGLLRYFVLLMAIGPVIGVILVWTWMAVHGPSPDRNEIYDRGNLTIGLLMVTAGVGIALESLRRSCGQTSDVAIGPAARIGSDGREPCPRPARALQ